MNTTHLFWLASVKSFAKIIFTVCKGNGPHYFVTSGVTVGSRMLWAKPWPGMCNVSLFFLFTSSTYSLLFLYSGLDWIISRVDDEECNDVGFKDALVMQDIQPIGALSRVVLGTLMKQPWVPYEYKCLLFCFATDPTEDEVHHAFCRFSCNRHINIFQMWIWLDFSVIDKGAFPMFNCQFMRNTSTYTLSLSIQVWFLFDFSKMSSWLHVASSLSNSLVYNGFYDSWDSAGWDGR